MTGEFFVQRGELRKENAGVVVLYINLSFVQVLLTDSLV
jgi:hypothetical protein